jgi:hypothetical protein
MPATPSKELLAVLERQNRTFAEARAKLARAREAEW